MRTRTQWLDIVRRDYKHLTAEAHEFLVDHILATHPEHQQPVACDSVEPAALEPSVITPDPSLWLKRIFWALVVLIVATIFAPHMHAQNGTSQIDVICVQNSNLPNGKACFAAPFNLGMSTGFTCSRSGSTVTCTGGGTITNNPGGSSNQLQYNNGGAFGAIASAGLGKVLIDQGAGSPPAFADPLVQGLYADGASSVAAPVIGGGYDTAGTPLIHRFTMQSTAPGGSDWGLVTRIAGTVPVSGTFWQSTQPVSIASMPSTPVTNAALSNLQFDASNFLKVILQNSSLAVTGTFWQATQPVSEADGANVTLGAKTDAKSTATDATAVSAISLLKEISAMVQAPPSQAVTNAGTFAVQNQQSNTTADYDSGAGTSNLTMWGLAFPASGGPVAAPGDSTNGLKVQCTSGCTAGGSFADSTAFTFGTTAVGNMSAVVDEVATNTVAENSAGALRMNTNRILYVDLSKTAANATALKVDGSAVTQPVSGTVAESNFPATVDTNSGVKSASTIRVVLATDQPALTNKLLVTPDSVALPANQSVNVSQINGVTTLMGNGASGTGAQRTVNASDNSAIANWGHGATGLRFRRMECLKD
jgi:hypothetical protein